MRNTRNFDVSGLNIRVHSEHAPREYVKLWRILNDTKQYVTYASNALMIGEMHFEDPQDPVAGIYGSFYRFLEVDTSHPWFNIEKKKKASDQDVEAVNIPAELKPGLVEIPYIFDVKEHRLYFVARETAADLSPRMVKRLLTALCAIPEVIDHFGVVDLTVVTDRGRVDKMLSWPVIRTLTIELDRPNPTDHEDEEYFLEKMQQRRIGKQVITYTKASEEVTIVPDDEMIKLAHVAADNGVVKVTGKNHQRHSARESSKDFPLAIKGSYNPNQQSLMEALKGVVKALLPKKK
jgi:hypothetical protein